MFEIMIYDCVMKGLTDKAGPGGMWKFIRGYFSICIALFHCICLLIYLMVYFCMICLICLVFFFSLLLMISMKVFSVFR